MLAKQVVSAYKTDTDNRLTNGTSYSSACRNKSKHKSRTRGSNGTWVLLFVVQVINWKQEKFLLCDEITNILKISQIRDMVLLHKLSDSPGHSNGLQPYGILPKINELRIFVVVEQHDSLAGRKFDLVREHVTHIRIIYTSLSFTF